jgi:cysteine-rich repeat protein
MNYSLRGCFSIALGTLLVIGCTGDDQTTDTAASATDSDTEGTVSNSTNTTPGTTTASTSVSGTDTMSGTGTDSDGTSTTMTSGESETDTAGTDTDSAVCGDGVVDGGEQCDDGESNGTEESTCNDDCTLKDAVCGNGVEEVGEECDDGNNDDGDGCAADCTIEMTNVCGDGMIGDDEECDDGNDVPADGCENDCTTSAPGECGNGEQEWDELCDDGNDVNGDGCEDNCTPTPEPACQMPEDYVSCDGALNKGDALAPFQALGLACSDKVNESILISNTSFNSPDANAWQIAKGFGTYQEMGQLLYSAREGESFIIMSSGTVSAPNGQGIVTETSGSQTGNGSNQNPDDDAFLPGYSPTDDQSGVLQPQWQKGNSNPNDKIWFSFKTQTPGGVKGYAVDFAFFSSEWPSWYDTTFNDLFVAWQVAEEFTGNISTIGDLPTTITALNPHWTADNNPSCPADTDGPGFSCNEPQLAGTGFEGHAGTTWVRINQPIMENAELELFFFLADMGDTVLASGVLLDRFRFNCDECIPADDPQCTGEVPSEDCCGVVLPQ